MTAYTPTVIGAGPLDGSVIDGNFDKFQTATGKLDGTNFANTDDLGFRNIHTGSVTETFVENGNPVVAIYNAFQTILWEGLTSLIRAQRFSLRLT